MEEGALLVSATGDSLGALAGGDALAGATRVNNGVSVDCACAHPGYWWPKGSAGAAEEGALLVSVTSDSLGASEGGDTVPGPTRGSRGVIADCAHPG